MKTGPDTSIARILGQDGSPVGAGCLVTPRHVITCAHVVADALGDEAIAFADEKPDGSITLDFPFVAPGAPCQASVVDWKPRRLPQPADGVSDMALLALAGNPPANTVPATLAHDDTLHRQNVDMYGFRVRVDDDIGDWVEGTTKRPRADGWFQIYGSADPAFFVDHGFSGSPVAIRDSDKVAGIVCLKAPEPDIKEAFAIPVEILVRVFPEHFRQARRQTQTPGSRFGMRRPRWRICPKRPRPSRRKRIIYRLRSR